MLLRSAGDGHLLRVLGLGFGLAVAVGAMIGAGILRAHASAKGDAEARPRVVGLPGSLVRSRRGL